MSKRTITGWTFLIIMCTVTCLGGWFFGAFIALLLILGGRELLKLLHSKNLKPSVVTCYMSSVLFLTLGCMNGIKYFHLAAIFLTICAFLAILKRGKDARIKDIGATLLFVLYGALLPSHLVFLRNIDAGTISYFGHDFSLALGYVILMVFGITATDVGAYVIGCKFGKHKLWEAISPKKTIEGSIGGAICTILVTLGCGYVLKLALWQTITVAILITVFAQIGDLLESMMKRDAGAKDASDILPGHGGLLDRVDSYVITSAVVYYFFYYFVVHPVI